MTTVHSEELGVTLNGNIVTFHNRKIDFVVAACLNRDQVTVTRVTEGPNPDFEISHPMVEEDHRTFAGLIHRQNSENKLKKKLDTGDKGPDNDGPKPTNPRGSGGKVVEQQNTYAVAA